MRRLAAHDQRRATLAIYSVLGELAGRGTVEAQDYYDRMSAFFGRGVATPPAQHP